MNSYYCIINTPGAPAREIVAIRAMDDVSARATALTLTAQWPGYETVTLYEGERPVAVLANPLLGFTENPLCIEDLAA